MGLVLTTAPALEPVTVAEQKLHSRIDTDADDTLLTAMITAARQALETETNRQFITATYTYTLEGFPGSYGAILLPRPALQSVTTVKYYDSTGTQQTLSSANYQVDTSSEPGRVAPAPLLSWPSVQADRYNAVEIVYTAGYGSSAGNVPQELRQAIMLLVSHWYENRETQRFGNIAADIAFGLDRLLWHYRIAEAY